MLVAIDSCSASGVAASRRTALDEKQPLKERIRAVQTLRLAEFADSRKVFKAILGPAQPSDVQLAALTSLSAFDQPAVAALLLENWSSFRSWRLTSATTWSA